MRSSIPEEEKLEVKKKTHKNMMWIAIASICMMFIGFSSGYIVSKGDNTWVSITMPDEFWISSVIIIISSITIFTAVRLAKSGKFKLVPVFVVATLVLGLAFVKYQMEGWDNLQSKGFFAVDAVKIKGLINNPDSEYGVDYKFYQTGDELKKVGDKYYDVRDEYNSNPIQPYFTASNNASSYLYLLTGLHIVHLLGGIISLLVVSYKSIRGKYNENDTVGLQVSALYWHFLDFLWLYLLFLLYYIG